MEIKDFFSPNCSKKNRTKDNIKNIIIHYTGMQSERESLKRLVNKKSKVSSHYFINKNGAIFRLVKDKDIAWHAGKSCWGKNNGLNKYSIGIELTNKGHRWGYKNFSNLQINSLIKLCKKIKKKYKILDKNVLGHSDIAPTRKMDPGEKFPWKIMAKNKVGIWHQLNDKQLKKYRRKRIFSDQDLKIFFKNLKKIGYCIQKNTNNNDLKKIVKAFQRHFRQQLVDGLIDLECVTIASNLAKKL